MNVIEYYAVPFNNSCELMSVDAIKIVTGASMHYDVLTPTISDLTLRIVKEPQPIN